MVTRGASCRPTTRTGEQKFQQRRKESCSPKAAALCAGVASLAATERSSVSVIGDPSPGNPLAAREVRLVGSTWQAQD